MPIESSDPAMRELLRACVVREIPTRWDGRELTFRAPVDVFSSARIDVGTEFLLRQLAATGRRGGSALDLGCGYGPIGIALAAGGAAERVLGIDRDALAVEFATLNAGANGVASAEFRGGLAYEDVAGERFDRIVSNLPAKAGEPVHRLMLLGAAERLRADGEVWIVVVAPLLPSLRPMLESPSVDVVHHEERRGHVVLGYRFTGPVRVPERPYRRGRARFEAGGQTYEMATTDSLEEYDRLSYETDLLVELCTEQLRGREPQGVLAWEPGQGHVPVVLARSCPGLARIDLCGRDLLALRASRANLLDAGFQGSVSVQHRIGVTHGDADDPPTLAIGPLSRDEGIEVSTARLRQARAALPGAALVTAGPSALGAQVQLRLAKTGMRPARSLKRRGVAGMVFAPER